MRRIGMVAAVLALVAAVGYAAPIMQVDTTAGGSSVQSGWLSLDYHDNPSEPTVTAGGVTASLWTSRPIGTASLAGGSSAYADMFADGAILGQQTYNGYGRVNFTGLTPGAQYDVRVWAYSGTEGIGNLDKRSTMSYALLDDLGLVITNLGTFDMAGAAPTNINDYSIAFTATATAGGKITLRQGTYNDGGVIEPYYGWTGPLGVINGFEISAHVEEPPVVPEPATLLLVGTGAVGVFGVIRRRMLK